MKTREQYKLDSHRALETRTRAVSPKFSLSPAQDTLIEKEKEPIGR